MKKNVIHIYRKIQIIHYLFPYCKSAVFLIEDTVFVGVNLLIFEHATNIYLDS